jgi:drug/metabolite transporter (DMT)-like permease
LNSLRSLIRFAPGLASSACYGVMFYLVHRSVSTLPATEIVFIRACVSVLVLSPYAYRDWRAMVSRASSALWLRSITTELSTICFTWNLQHTSVGFANAIYNIAPLLVLMLAWLTRSERPRLTRLFDFLLVVSGSFLFWSASSMSIGVGYVWIVGLLGALFATFSQLLLKRAVVRWSPGTLAWSMNLAGIPATLSLRHKPWVVPDHHAFISILLICTLSLFAQILFAISFKRLPGSTASALVPSSIVWGVLLDILRGGFPSEEGLAGCLLYIAGITRIFLAMPQDRAAPVDDE